MAEDLGHNQGFFSLLRWRSDAMRDEARNVAVILVEAEGQFGAIKAAPLSTISPRLHEQGILDTLVEGLASQFDQDRKPTLADLRRWHESMQQSLCVTEPKAVAVSDVDSVLRALYRSFVAPRSGGGGTLTKGRVLDRVTDTLRRRGYSVRRGNYIGDFIFDIVFEEHGRAVVEVLSFATRAQNWIPVEHDAGYFLYALRKTNAEGFAVLEPPTDASHQGALNAYDRIRRWFGDAHVPALETSELREGPLPVVK